jgi:AcrR family transcriptional regulator
MTTSSSSAAAVSRPRNAAASKGALLAAARELFGQKGFEATTIREIGQRAGIDAALIARYFGSKADLYVAAVVAESQDEHDAGPAYENVAQIAEALLSRADTRGPGPIVQALVRADTSEEIRAAAQAHLSRRIVEPLRGALRDRGVDEPSLRAEVAVWALIGISLGRALGPVGDLRSVPRHELVALVTELLGDR